MSLLPAPPPKPRLTVNEQLTRETERQRAIELRLMVWQALNNRGIISPAKIAAAIGMAVPDAAKVLEQIRWREGDVARLEAAAVRLGLDPEQS